MGCRDGWQDGCALGCVGEPLGCLDGWRVGCLDGCSDGCELGGALGWMAWQNPVAGT